MIHVDEGLAIHLQGLGWGACYYYPLARGQGWLGYVAMGLGSGLVVARLHVERGCDRARPGLAIVRPVIGADA